MLNKDYSDFITALQHNDVRFVIIGAYALSFYGEPRMTGDIDFWIYPDKDNAERLLRALSAFGFASASLSAADILSGNVIQLGVPPVRIDLLTELSGVTTDEIWDQRIRGNLDTFAVDYIGKDTLIKNKRTIGRHKDLADIEAIQDS